MTKKTITVVAERVGDTDRPPQTFDAEIFAQAVLGDVYAVAFEDNRSGSRLGREGAEADEARGEE